MQVNSSAAASYYTSYQRNTSVKYHGGYTQTENGDLLPNEKSAEEGFAEFVDYQEFHKAWMSQNGRAAGSVVTSTKEMAVSSSGTFAENTVSSISNAVTIVEEEGKGEFLGIAMVPEDSGTVTYGMSAKLLESSTSDNPIVQVVSKLGGEKVVYNVEVNKVDPGNATQLEMFALFSYTDEMGITDGGALGSYQKLKVYGSNASQKGYCNDLSGKDVFVNETFNWNDIMQKMMQDYYDAKIMGQYENCKELVDFFETVKVKSAAEKENTVAAQGPEEKKNTVTVGNMVEKETVAIEEASSLLLTESTTCTYPTADPDDEDILYVTWYTEEGIFCKKLGQEAFEWSIAFENREQYNKVMAFIGQFPSDWNMRFAAHENFWTDFLNDKIDMDGFMKFMETTNKGVPDYSITIGDSMYIDKDKVQWAEYLNPLGSRFYTAEEMRQMQMEKMAANNAGNAVTSNTTGRVSASNNEDQYHDYESENYRLVADDESSCFYVYKNGEKAGTFFYNDINIKVDQSTGTKLLLSVGGTGAGMYNVIPMDEELEKVLEEATGGELEQVALIGFSVRTHAGTGIQYVMRDGAEGYGGKVLLQSEEDVRKYNELAEKYYSSYPNLVTDISAGRIYAAFEICGMTQRTAGGFVNVHYDSISYYDNEDAEKSWTLMIDDGTWDKLSKWLNENRMQIRDMQMRQTWLELFKKIGGSYKEPEVEEDYHAFIQKRIEEMHEKIKNGDIEVRIQIGAQEFSEEEWDKLLERFDKTEEELREQMREEHEKRKEEAQEEELERKMQLSKENNI